MKKEVLFAIIFGFLVALGITFFIYISNNKKTTIAIVSSPTPTPITTLPTKDEAPLSLITPENEAVFEDKSLTITGKTFPDLPIVVFVNQKDFFVTSDSSGNFSLDINLESGSNLIIATSVDQNGINYSDQRLAVYTNKSLEETLVSESEITDE